MKKTHFGFECNTEKNILKINKNPGIVSLELEYEDNDILKRTKLIASQTHYNHKMIPFNYHTKSGRNSILENEKKIENSQGEKKR